MNKDTNNSDVGFKIILRYQNKEYTCDAYGWYEEDWKEWISAYEDDGVRNCEHDYAALLPHELVGDKEFGCEQKEIKVIDYWFYDKKTNQKINS